MTDVFTDDELYAYLDGELSEEELVAFESRLATDPELSERLEYVRDAWTLLDHLEPVTKSDDFTKSTMALAAVELDSPSFLEKLRSNWRLIVGSILALAIGFACVFIPATIQNQQQLRDIPIVNDLDLYRRADSVTFLRELNEAGLFLPDFALDAAFGSDSAANVAPQTPGKLSPFADVSESKLAISAMTKPQLVELQRKQETFESLKTTEQERLRQLHIDLVADKDRDRLYSVLVRYQQWLKSLSSLERAEIESVASQERIDRIRELRLEQERSRFAELELNEDSTMPDEDVDEIMSWMRGYLRRHEDDLLRQVPEQLRRWANDPRRRGRILPVLVSQGKVSAVPATNEEFSQLIQNVSKEMAPKLGRLDSDAKVELIQSWLTSWGKSVRPMHPQISHEQLGRFIRDELSQDDRKRMESLSGAEAREELMRLYFRKHGNRGRRGRGAVRPHDRERNDRERDERAGDDRDGQYRSRRSPPPRPDDGFSSGPRNARPRDN